MRCNFTENIIGTGELNIEWCGAFFPQGAWHLKIEVLLTSFNNVYIISFEKLHKEAVGNKVKRQ